MPHPNVLSGREELLTEHALTWNKRKIKKMAVYLAKRFTKVGLNKKIQFMQWLMNNVTQYWE